MTPAPADMTRLLQAWSCGDAYALGDLMPMVYAELRHIAMARFRGERSGHTLQPTAVVNEVYLRLAASKTPQWQSRSQFFAFAGMLMRRILVDHARQHRAAKRGGAHTTIQLEETDPTRTSGQTEVDMIALHEALTALERLEPRQCRIVELRYFAGLTIDETASVLGVSISTVKEDWKMAKTWLYRELRRRP